MDSNLACPVCSLTEIIVAGDDLVDCEAGGNAGVAEASGGDDGRDGRDATGHPPRDVRDANGNPLRDGDTVTLVKDLKLKGTSSTIKVGTRISHIRIVTGDHEVDCKVDGRPILLKAQYLKKV